jgi:hypothetical protein
VGSPGWLANRRVAGALVAASVMLPIPLHGGTARAATSNYLTSQSVVSVTARTRIAEDHIVALVSAEHVVAVTAEDDVAGVGPAVLGVAAAYAVIAGPGADQVATTSSGDLIVAGAGDDMAKERRSMWLLKRYGLPFLYWHLMLKGRL